MRDRERMREKERLILRKCSLIKRVRETARDRKKTIEIESMSYGIAI